MVSTMPATGGRDERGGGVDSQQRSELTWHERQNPPWPERPRQRHRNDSANIYPASGANILNGGSSSGSLSGGAGSDIYEFTTALGAGNIDAVLTSIRPADTIRLVARPASSGARQAHWRRRLPRAGAAAIPRPDPLQQRHRRPASMPTASAAPRPYSSQRRSGWR